eukprot:gene5097-34897_t
MGQVPSTPARRAPFEEVARPGEVQPFSQLWGSPPRSNTPGVTAVAAPAGAAASSVGTAQAPAISSPPESSTAPVPSSGREVSTSLGTQASSGAGSSSSSGQPRAHKNVTIIPGWSRTLSSQHLQVECQKVQQPLQEANTLDCVGLLDIELMKYVAYCGGLTIKLRIDEMHFGAAEGLTWGLMSTKPCPAFAASAPNSIYGGASELPPCAEGSNEAAPSASGSAAATSTPSPLTPGSVVQLDNTSRKPLHVICSATVSHPVKPNDLITIELSPREDKQPVIVTSLKCNNVLVHQASMPCNSVSMLHIYPFITVLPGMSISLHESTTPSPLFSWFSLSGSVPPEVQLAELDICAKYNSLSSTPATSTNGVGTSIDFLGSTTFTSTRQRWTVQIDNLGSTPAYVYVGVTSASHDQAVGKTNSNILASVQGPLRSIAGAATTSSPSGSGAAAGSNSFKGAAPSEVPVPPPPAPDANTHLSEGTAGHCFITVDLDLTAGYVRFFRNGHLISSAFNGVSGPVSPAISFLQAPSVSCQAGLVNLTKLKQADMRWSVDRCSGDLRLVGFVSGVHLWLIKVNNLSEPDSIFIGVCRGCMPLDQDPQDLRDRTYYLSNGVVRVGGRRVSTNAANFTKGDVVGVVLDADQGEIVFFRNGVEQGRSRGIRGRLYPFVSCDSEGDNISLVGSYSLQLNRSPRQLADMEWDTLYHNTDMELSSNCLTATKTSSSTPSTVRGTILYNRPGLHEFHVILDNLGPDGVWVGVAPPGMSFNMTVGDTNCGWSLHSDGDKRFDGREEEYSSAFKNGDVLTVCLDLDKGSLRFSRNGMPLGETFHGLQGPLVAAVTMASEESKVTIQNRPTVLNTGEYTGELRWDDTRAGKDLHVIDGLTVTKMANEGGDYATVLGTLCLASGQHTWNVYINHVEDSNLFIGVTVGGHDLNADPQEMKHRTYYLSNGTIRVAGKLVTRCAEPYAEGDLVTVQLDMEQRHVSFLKNGLPQGAGDGLPEEVWPYVSLDNIMDSITLHSSNMFVDLVLSLRWNPEKACKMVEISKDGQSASLTPGKKSLEEAIGQATVLGLREHNKTEVHSWIVRFSQPVDLPPANFLVGVAPPAMDLNKSLGEDGCGIGLDYYGYFYINGRYFHSDNMSNWAASVKPVRGSTAKHKGKNGPIFNFVEGKCEVTVTLDLKEGTLKFSHEGRSLGTIAGVRGPLHAAVTLTSSKQVACLALGPIGKNEHTNEELLYILKAKGCVIPPRLEAALLLVPRDIFVPRDRHREAFRDLKVTVRMMDGSSMTLPPPSFVANALEKLGGTSPVHGIECVSSRLEQARSNIRMLRERLGGVDTSSIDSSGSSAATTLGDPARALLNAELSLSNVLIPECTDGVTYDAIYCDASLTEEELPAFLSLLKPGGRMVAIIEEEALLFTRTGQDFHDFDREVLIQVSGDFGELEQPTPWEVQEAILRIKERERRRGIEQAKAESSTRGRHELFELQDRVQRAMQRITELESMIPSTRSPVRPAAGVGMHSPLRLTHQRPHSVSPSPTRISSIDDTRRGAGRDKSRSKVASKLTWGDSSTSPVADKDSRKDDDVALGDDADIRGEVDAGLRARSVVDSADGAAVESVVPNTFADIIDSMSVQMFTPEQISTMIGGASPIQVENRDMYPGSYKGVRIRVWKVPISQSVSYLELKRAYSKYCIAHPHIAAVLGVCIQDDDHSDDVDYGSTDNAGSRDASGAGDAVPDVRQHLWVVEEAFGDETLFSRLERGLLSWQQVVRIATDIGKALAFLQDLKRASALCDCSAPADQDSELVGEGDAGAAVNGSYDGGPPPDAVLSAYALRTIVTPSNVHMDAQSTKVSVLPALLNHLESALCDVLLPSVSSATPLHCQMAYVDPHSLFSEASAPSFYALGVVLLQLLTEQGPLGLLSGVKESMEAGTLLNLIPRLPANDDMKQWAVSYCNLALKCTEPGGITNLESELLPELEALFTRLGRLGSKSMSWEQVEEMLMLPLQPRCQGGDTTNRRWVRQDFRMRRKLFLEEVAKLAVDGPVHKMELRRARCFKDSISMFAGKGHAIWRQPLKISFLGEAGMDSGGVTREWFSILSSAITRGSPELFWAAGPQKNQLYINPVSSTPSHLRKFQFVGMFMAKAILESAARGKELGSITLSLLFCEPFWKLLLGIPLNLMDLQLLDPTEFRSLMSILDMDIEGLIFETFSWNFHHSSLASGGANNNSPGFTQSTSVNSPVSNPTGLPATPQASPLRPTASLPSSLPTQENAEESIPTTPTTSAAAAASASSPFGGQRAERVDAVSSIPLKPGGGHLKVTNHNKREYVLLKAHKMLVGSIEGQMTAIIDAFHSIIPRDLIDKYNFTSLELQLLVCGEQRIDVQDLMRHCKYEDGYNGEEESIGWFWEVVESLDDPQRRQLLQFWSGSDGMPAEGFGALDPAFHVVAVERIYDANDTTARLPAAHTCFRQLDLPRYRSKNELRDKLITAITIGGGYMALS